MTETGLLGGSFNPVHLGHIRLGQWLVDRGLFDRVWFNLSPLNPLKAAASDLASDADRAAMLRLALMGRDALLPCFVELEMPRPSYTIDTLERLSAEHPDCSFSLIIGSDNWQVFDSWRRASDIIDRYGVTIYPRPGYEISAPLPPGVRFAAGAPMSDISASSLRTDPDLRRQWLAPSTFDYIKAHKLYD